jgi:hypothetical protein
MGKKARPTDNGPAAPAHFKNTVFDEWPLQNGETVRVSTGYKSFLDLVHVRRWQRGPRGQLYPTEKGIAIQIGHLQRLLKALRKVRKHARELGILSSPSQSK